MAANHGCEKCKYSSCFSHAVPMILICIYRILNCASMNSQTIPPQLQIIQCICQTFTVDGSSDGGGQKVQVETCAISEE